MTRSIWGDNGFQGIAAIMEKVRMSHFWEGLFPWRSSNTVFVFRPFWSLRI